jgi:hypothetical protein
MAAGFQVTKDALNQRLGSIVVAGEAWFEDVERLAAWLAATPDADLVALGFTSGDAAQMKSAFTDLDNLRQTAYGQRAQPAASNFFFWAAKLRGIL